MPAECALNVDPVKPAPPACDGTGGAFLKQVETATHQSQVIQVLDSTEDIVAAFGMCNLTCISAGMGIYWQGVAVTDISAAAALLNISPGRQPAIAAGCRFMGQVQAEELNRRAIAK